MPAHGQTRYAAALEKMSIVGIPARFGEKAKNEWAFALNEWVKFGKHVYMSHNEVLGKDGKLHRDPIQLDDSSDPAKLKTMSDNQRYWTQRRADQMNYRYWKERCLAEQTDEAVRRGSCSTRARSPTRRASSPRPRRSSRKGSRSGRWRSTTTPRTGMTTCARRIPG